MKSGYMSPEIGDYVARHSTPPDSLLRELATETAKATGNRAGMQISPDQGAFLTMITRLIGAMRAVEVGTFTGYSSICIARGMPPGGHLLAMDVSLEWTTIAKRFWAKAGLADRISLQLGPAADTLRSLPHDLMIDLAFIDADKVNYHVYYEELLVRLRQGGLIIVDNVLWGGKVVDPAVQDADTTAIRDFNEKVLTDSRVDCVMVPIADGLTLCRKR